jgi:hypothetical protein
MAAGAGFLLHNAIDFTFYLPGVALPAAVLLGLGSPGAAGSMEGADRGGTEEVMERGATAPRIVSILLALLLLAQAGTADRSAWHLDRARILALGGSPLDAEAEARAAAAACPWNPDPWAFLAQSLLARRASGPEEESLRRRSAERAAHLEPEGAILHHTVALDRAAASDPASAWLEEERAHRLYPGKALYRPAPEEAR